MTSNDRLCPLTHSPALSQEESLHSTDPCSAAIAGKMHTSEQTDLYGLPIPREGVLTVSLEKVSWWALRKLCYPGNGCQCAKPCPFCLWLQPKV